jgi:hypothetical protein
LAGIHTDSVIVEAAVTGNRVVDGVHRAARTNGDQCRSTGRAAKHEDKRPFGLERPIGT